MATRAILPNVWIDALSNARNRSRGRDHLEAGSLLRLLACAQILARVARGCTLTSPLRRMQSQERPARLTIYPHDLVFRVRASEHARMRSHASTLGLSISECYRQAFVEAMHAFDSVSIQGEQRYLSAPPQKVVHVKLTLSLFQWIESAPDALSLPQALILRLAVNRYLNNA